MGRARIWAPDRSDVVGAGVLVTPDAVLTCWHVVDPAEVGSETIAVDFPDARDGLPTVAEIDRFVPVDADGGGDLAVLRLAESGPVPAARLTRLDGEADVRVFGYPRGFPTGVWTRARIVGLADARTGWRQLDRHADGIPIEVGFSGAGVIHDSGAVLGIIVARAAWAGNVVAWMIPADRWEPVLPEVFSLFRTAPGPEPLSFRQKTALAAALGEVQVMADVSGRRLVVRNLPPEMGRVVPSFDVTNLALLGLVEAVLGFDRGFAELYTVVAALAGDDASAVIRLRHLAAGYGLLGSAR